MGDVKKLKWFSCKDKRANNKTMTSLATSFVTDEQLKEMELEREDCRAMGTDLRLPALSPELRRRLYALNNTKVLLANKNRTHSGDCL